jgi:P27 family predicted phage terminase small subunit
MRGRKPLATKVAEANGSYRKNPSRKPANIINAAAGIPVKPDFVELDETASAVWDETVGVLKDCGILSETDTHLLTSYVSCYAEWLKAYLHVSKHGHESDGKTSPQSMTFHKLADRHLKLLGELGLSPSSRARLSVATSKDQETQGVSLASIIKDLQG